MKASNPSTPARSQLLHWFALLAIALSMISGCENKPKTFGPGNDPTGKRLPPQTKKKSKQASLYTKHSPPTTATTSKRSLPR
jgi:hypothetical protein